MLIAIHVLSIPSKILIPNQAEKKKLLFDAVIFTSTCRPYMHMHLPI